MTPVLLFAQSIARERQLLERFTHLVRTAHAGLG
jgi:hypothetical protein